MHCTMMVSRAVPVMVDSKILLIFILVIVLPNLSTTAQPYNHYQDIYNQFRSTLPEDIANKIDLFASSFINCSTLIGMNVAVVKNGETVFSNGYGIMDLESQKEVTLRTLYSVGSLTKSITSTLLGKILKENGLSWDTKVMDILSDEEFQFIDPMLTCQVTLKDLAAHRTGISSRNYAVFQNITRKELVENMRFSQKQNQFRDGFTYNNNLYGVMAYIIEKLSGESYEELVGKEIFIPLKMNSSMFMHQMDLSDENLAHPYQGDPLDDNRPRPVSKQFVRDIDKVGAGAGSVVSTAEDMAQYMKLHMGLGVVDGVRIFPADVVEEIQGHYTIDPVDDFGITRPQFPATYERNSYGFGPMSGSYKGYKMINFFGNLLGYGSMATYLPDENFGVYAQGVTLKDLDWNIQHPLLFMYIADLLLGEEPWLNETTVCTFPEPWINGSTSEFTKRSREYPYDESNNDDTAHNKPSRSQDNEDVLYLGQYGNFQYGNISITANGTADTEALILSYGVGEWTLTPTADNVFLGVPHDSSFPMYIPGIEFRKLNAVNGQFDEVLIAFAEPDYNIFQRGLKLSDTPPFKPVSCEHDCPDSGGVLQQSSVLLTAFLFIVANVQGQF